MPCPTARDMLREIFERTNWDESEIGRELKVHQSTVSRLAAGKIKPRKTTYEKIRNLLEKVRRAWFTRLMQTCNPKCLKYLCSKSGEYPDDRAARAEAVLRQSWEQVLSGQQVAAQFLEFHLEHVRLRRPPPSAPRERLLTTIVLSAGLGNANAHCYCDDLSDPHVFVVLVSSALRPNERRDTVRLEIDGHLRPLLDSAADQGAAPRTLGRYPTGEHE